MNLLSFGKREKSKDGNDLWTKCNSCGKEIEIERSLNVCPACGFHFRLDVEARINLVFDNHARFFGDIKPVDFLGFEDTMKYERRLLEAQNATKQNDAVMCVEGNIVDIKALAAVFNFKFMGGSLGSVVGEKITLLLEKGAMEKIPAIIFCASGGARMQEGIMSLMQMAKVTAAISRLNKARVPYVTVLTDPTLGGVSASMAMLGDIILAEPGATIGFAGSRVIEETSREKLPKGFQRSEYLFEHGIIDGIVPRKSMKQELYDWLSLFV